MLSEALYRGQRGRGNIINKGEIKDGIFFTALCIL